VKKTVAPESSGRILAVGFFDGVHLGHRRILAGADAVFTFSNHPLGILDPSRMPALLMGAKERISMLASAGTVHPRAVHAVRFTRRFAKMSPTDFVAYLRRLFPNLEKVHCGGNWRFGLNGAGTAQTLRDAGISVKVSRYAKVADCVISSTRIRAALAEGDVEAAAAMLGRRFSVSGRVVAGKGLGRKIGCPTLNIEVSVPLRLGVYVVDTPLGRGIANYGIAPTMKGKAWKSPVLEVHLIDCAAGAAVSIGGRRITVEFLRFLRPERKFSCLQELRAQIAADLKSAK
jgi:riboflavin kinase/FMN adenylyltransferase